MAFAVCLVYVLAMVPFCVLVGSRTSRRMGWMMSVPLLLFPLALLLAFLVH
ncbi:hypothetical protein FHV95_12341 [Streptomyces coelicolor]|nr:hypothetical protein FHV91_12370 [Streptomyces coelicolor]TYP05150.1 hypothetical protein FHV98_12241 [Streptomyces coelicolor A3(2)]TYP24297.1 hypothetical protein FHV94_12470 [Streptomyces coelicolor]TYP25851.1 hypothetical protein FHV92_12370 [Streptomyces coelicolor]TYP43939.1 hypothetical protein FHV95_12341 [Streptomyces coelicolor]